MDDERRRQLSKDQKRTDRLAAIFKPHFFVDSEFRACAAFRSLVELPQTPESLLIWDYLLARFDWARSLPVEQFVPTLLAALDRWMAHAGVREGVEVCALLAAFRGRLIDLDELQRRARPGPENSAGRVLSMLVRRASQHPLWGSGKQANLQFNLPRENPPVPVSAGLGSRLAARKARPATPAGLG